MASTSNNLFHTIIFLLLILLIGSHAGAPFKPNTLILPLRKDTATSLHTINLRKRTPQVTVPLAVDLNGRFLWLNCEQNYTSSTYHAPFCHSTQCSRAGDHYCHKCTSNTPHPGCHNNTCAVVATNPITQKNAISELAQDLVSIQSLDRGLNSSRWVNVPQFLFACAPSSLLQGPYPPGVRGIAGLGHTPVALPIQLASHFGFHPQFALCLSPSTADTGAVFFGNIPAKIRPRTMAYTPLTIGAQGEYFILVKSIKINNIHVPFNTSLLSRTRGFGGTMISTVKPYTVMEHSVFTTFTQFFADQMKGVPQVETVSPFGLCFDARILPPTTRVGTPNMDFVFQNKNVSWRVFGVDALVRVKPNVSCLGFVDGGSKTRAAITIGAYQLENNFLEFDLLRSRVGFRPSRLSEPSFTCSKFNFTSDEHELPLEFSTIGD